MHLYALHGFLGRPEDWKILSPLSYTAVDLSQGPANASLLQWAEAFNLETVGQKAKRVICGYSLGGRLALHALLQNPSQWDAAILVSTHTGLSSREERENRLTSDYLWAERFETEPWEPLMKAWNAQSVFCGDASAIERRASDYQRSLLASALRHWSLGRQENLQIRLSMLNIPILWMVGEMDVKFRELTTHIQFKHPLSTKVVVPNAGHRLPWEQPQMFLSHIKRFLN